MYIDVVLKRSPGWQRNFRSSWGCAQGGCKNF